MNAVLLWIAQGFGIGRIPVAPGTFGSAVGLLWTGLLLWTGNIWLYITGTIIGASLSVWLCGVGEKILGKKDPGSVVMDEIAAMPVCFLACVGISLRERGVLPSFDDLFSIVGWAAVVFIFALFRLFDVWKPWPVRQSQSLPGGWGVTIDDVLAALYVNLVTVVCVYFVK